MMLSINAYVTSCKLAVAVEYSVRAAKGVNLVNHILVHTASKIWLFYKIIHIIGSFPNS